MPGLLCLFICAFLLVAPEVHAKASDRGRGQKHGVVAVYVNDKTGRHVASATGVVVDRRGVVATSCYIIPKWLDVVENTLVIRTEDSREFPLEYLISGNCSNGVALVKVKGTAFQEANLASTYRPKKSEVVTVITMPSQETAVSSGRVKGIARDESFQITVAVTPGRDGSPVMNTKGEVIGIATFSAGRKKKQPLIIPAKNVAKEYNRYRHLIPETLPSSPEPAKEPSRVPSTKPQEKGADREQGNAEKDFALALSQEKATLFQEAIDSYRKAIRSRPDYFEAFVNLGLLYYKLGRYDEAVDAYRHAMTIKPADKSVYNKLGATYIILGNYSMALDALKQSLKMDPGNPETHFNLGVVLVITGDRSGAIEEYHALKKIDVQRAGKLLDLIY